MVMTKQITTTQVPMADVPKEFREQLILQTLLPEYVIPCRNLTEFMTEQMKDLVNTYLPDKLNILTQYRILLGHLDPK